MRGFYVEHERVQLEFAEGSGRTRPEFKDEADVNNIMKRFEKTGLIDHVATYQGQYGDFTTSVEDYHGALNLALRAEAMFASLPAKVRRHFDNDPGKFLAA